MRRVDLQRQRRDSTPDAVEASRSEQLRSDIVTFLRATSGGPSPWFLALVLFPDFGRPSAMGLPTPDGLASVRTCCTDRTKSANTAVQQQSGLGGAWTYMDRLQGKARLLGALPHPSVMRSDWVHCRPCHQLAVFKVPRLQDGAHTPRQGAAHRAHRRHGGPAPSQPQAPGGCCW